MKKKRKILLRILAVILILIAVAIAAVFLIFGKDNVIAAIKGLTTSTENIEQKIQDTEKEQVEMLNEHGMYLTKEDLDKINSGELVDEEEIVKKLLGDKTEEKTTLTEETEASETDVQTEEPEVKNDDVLSEETIENDKTVEKQNADEKKTSVEVNVQEKTEQPKVDNKDKVSEKAEKPEDKNKDVSTTAKEPAVSTTQPDKKKEQTESNVPDVKTEADVIPEKNTTDTKETPTVSGNSDEVDKQIASLVAKMYVYKSQYTSSIASLVNAMFQEFYSTFPAEEQVYANKLPIYNRYSGKIAAMEAQCDAQVETLIAELKTLLIENGRDVSLADSLLAAYNTEKENSKAYHISRFAD